MEKDRTRGPNLCCRVTIIQNPAEAGWLLPVMEALCPRVSCLLIVAGAHGIGPAPFLGTYQGRADFLAAPQDSPYEACAVDLWHDAGRAAHSFQNRYSSISKTDILEAAYILPYSAVILLDYFRRFTVDHPFLAALFKRLAIKTPIVVCDSLCEWSDLENRGLDFDHIKGDGAEHEISRNHWYCRERFLRTLDQMGLTVTCCQTITDKYVATIEQCLSHVADGNVCTLKPSGDHAHICNGTSRKVWWETARLHRIRSLERVMLTGFYSRQNFTAARVSQRPARSEFKA